MTTPIHPDHRNEAIDELLDLANQLQTSEALTYQDLDQRLSSLSQMVQIWRPLDDQLEATVQAIATAQTAIKNYVWKTENAPTKDFEIDP